MVETAAPDAEQAPADSPSPKASHPTKGRRFRILDGDDGDVCIVRVITEGDQNFPVGTLLPIAQVPRFETVTEALKWIENDSGDLLHGFQIMVFWAKEILNIAVENKPIVKITKKPKRQIAGPPVEAGP